MTDSTTARVKFSLDPKSGVPFYKQVILQIEMAIADGRLTSGDQLPTVRSLAVDLSINPNTVARSYNELEIRGIVHTQQGTGTFISNKKIELDDIKREKGSFRSQQIVYIKSRFIRFQPERNHQLSTDTLMRQMKIKED